MGKGAAACGGRSWRRRTVMEQAVGGVRRAKLRGRRSWKVRVEERRGLAAS
mgnify:CR=1 FL=1